MKKLIAIILTVMLIVSVCPFGAFNFTASAATGGKTGSCTWSLDGTTLTISGNGAMANYSYNSTLPWGKNITGVIIETGVTSIGDFAFAACSALSSITIPDGVTSIGISAFSECESLRNITIPNGVKSIGAQAFFSCKSLTSITIPDSVDIIEPFAFMHCVNLKNITIPNSITSIGDSAFSYCDSLKNAYYKGTESQRQEISIDSFGNDYLLNATWYYNSCIGAAEHTYDNTSDIQCNECGYCRYITYTISNGEATITDCDEAISGNVTIPSTIEGYPVTSIGDYVFSNCSKLTSVTIPDSVTNIGKYAFRDCSSLTSVTIPNSVTSIVFGTFMDCKKLTHINVDSNNKNYSSEDGVLFNKTKTTLICYPSGKIGEYTIPDSVTSIDERAFYNCHSLTSIIIPNSVTSIGWSAFYCCNSITNITIPSSVTNISLYAFADCKKLTHINVDSNNKNYSSEDGVLFNKTKTTLICYPSGKIGEYTIPDSVTNIGDCAFLNCSSLTNIRIQEGVTGIGIQAFTHCNSLISITIPNSVTSIGEEAFRDCSSLTSITIPNSVTSIGYGTFASCRSLTSVTIPNSVTNMGERVFAGCSSLTSITIPNSVTCIGEYAFFRCSSLKSVTIPYSVTSIGDDAFDGCSSLTSVTITNGVTSIGYATFADCSSLASVTIPDSVTSIGDFAFLGCSALKSVYITDIAAWSNIEFGNTKANPLYYGAELYLNNQLVTEITVPETQIIDENRYYNIKSLKNIFLPKELVLVKQNAFYSCSGLENVYFEGTADEWAAVTVLSGNDYLKNANVFFNCTKIPGGLTGIEITKLPEKVQYIEKKETLDLTGGILTLYYADGATTDIDLATLIVEGFDNTALGKQTITVKYGIFSTQFEIEIIERPKTFVSIIQLPDKNQYTFGESLDLTGGKIAVGYPDGTYEILDITADMVSGYDANDIGYQILTVTYGSFTANFIVSVTNDGDLNGDGIVNLLDLVKFKKLLAGVETSTNLPLDFDGDGKTTATDMIMLMGIILAPNKK